MTSFSDYLLVLVDSTHPLFTEANEKLLSLKNDDENLFIGELVRIMETETSTRVLLASIKICTCVLPKKPNIHAQVGSLDLINSSVINELFNALLHLMSHSISEVSTSAALSFAHFVMFQIIESNDPSGFDLLINILLSNKEISNIESCIASIDYLSQNNALKSHQKEQVFRSLYQLIALTEPSLTIKLFSIRIFSSIASFIFACIEDDYMDFVGLMKSISMSHDLYFDSFLFWNEMIKVDFSLIEKISDIYELSLSIIETDINDPDILFSITLLWNSTISIILSLKEYGLFFDCFFERLLFASIKLILNLNVMKNEKEINPLEQSKELMKNICEFNTSHSYTLLSPFMNSFIYESDSKYVGLWCVYSLLSGNNTDVNMNLTHNIDEVIEMLNIELDSECFIVCVSIVSLAFSIISKEKQDQVFEHLINFSLNSKIEIFDHIKKCLSDYVCPYVQESALSYYASIVMGSLSESEYEEQLDRLLFLLDLMVGSFVENSMIQDVFNSAVNIAASPCNEIVATALVSLIVDCMILMKNEFCIFEDLFPYSYSLYEMGYIECSLHLLAGLNMKFVGKEPSLCIQHLDIPLMIINTDFFSPQVIKHAFASSLFVFSKVNVGDIATQFIETSLKFISDPNNSIIDYIYCFDLFSALSCSNSSCLLNFVHQISSILIQTVKSLEINKADNTQISVAESILECSSRLILVFNSDFHTSFLDILSQTYSIIANAELLSYSVASIIDSIHRISHTELLFMLDPAFIESTLTLAASNKDEITKTRATEISALFYKK